MTQFTWFPNRSQSSDGDSLFLPWKLVWNTREILWKYAFLAVIMAISPISSIRGMKELSWWHDTNPAWLVVNVFYRRNPVYSTEETLYILPKKPYMFYQKSPIYCTKRAVNLVKKALWHTYEWVMSHIWMNYVIDLNKCGRCWVLATPHEVRDVFIRGICDSFIRGVRDWFLYGVVDLFMCRVGDSLKKCPTLSLCMCSKEDEIRSSGNQMYKCNCQ